ncbi:MAG TPA: ferrochelatase [Phycisphaerae bacterium]|jgi:ferrochelatase
MDIESKIGNWKSEIPGQPFDAVLLISFGGPRGVDEIRPFLQNVLRGRRVPPQRVEAVAQHYELFGGVSPITELTLRQARALRERLRHDGPDLPVYVGMRNWHPFLADTLAAMADAGVRRAIGFILAAHRSYSSCGQYRQNVIDARHELRQRGKPDVRVTFVDDWHTHAGFIAASAQHVRAALARLAPAEQEHARIIFTAHSIPLTMARTCRYQEQLLESARLVGQRLGRDDWALVFQSRSGRPDDPWLEPDIGDYLRAEATRGLKAAVLCPIGFVCDHIEVLYDLDHEAASVCRALHLPMQRAEAVNDDPLFIEMLADVVGRTYEYHVRAHPLPIVPPTMTINAEGLPPAR